MLKFIYFSGQPLLLKGIHIHSVKICEIFADVKKIEWMFWKNTKTRHKTGTHLKT